jgi:hypothetical protein
MQDYFWDGIERGWGIPHFETRDDETRERVPKANQARHGHVLALALTGVVPTEDQPEILLGASDFIYLFWRRTFLQGGANACMLQLQRSKPCPSSLDDRAPSTAPSVVPSSTLGS